ncbi:RAB GDP/GTP exchange factor [Entamoeba marina]
MTITTHPIIRKLLHDKISILRDAIKLNAILLLPPAYTLSDLYMTNDFFYSHFILIDTETHRFITLTQIPGIISESVVRFYMSDVREFFGMDFEDFEEILINIDEIFTTCAPIYSTRITGIETFASGETLWNRLTVIQIKSPVFQHGCSWAWKLMDGNAPFSFNEFTIELSLDETIESIQNSIPGFNEAKEVEMVMSQPLNPMFTSPLTDRRRNELKRLNTKQQMVYKKILNTKSLLIHIDTFVATFPQMVRGLSLPERKNVILGFIKELMVLISNVKVFAGDEKHCVIVLQRLLHTRVFKYIWPPSITILEDDNAECVELDEIANNKIFDHQFVTPQMLGLDFDEEKSIIPMSYAINCLKQIDSVRTAQDKLAYIYVSLKIIEQNVIFATGNVSADSFVPLVIFTLMKANLPHLNSTIEYITTFSDTTRGALSCYFCNFLAAVTFITDLSKDSLHFENSDEYDQLIEQTHENSLYDVRVPCPIIPPSKLLGFIDVVESEEPLVQLYRLLSVSSENFPREDIPILLKVLNQLYDENKQLKISVRHTKHK